MHYFPSKCYNPCMKGHVFIADEHSLKISKEKGFHGVFAESETKDLYLKTRADILADLSCIRQGDHVFFYNTDSQTFSGIYEATSRVFFDKTDAGYHKPAPYRIGVRPLLPLKKPISETHLFSRRSSARDFRSIFYKKALRRGKACTHLFPDETESLTKALLMQNDNIPKPGKLPFPISEHKNMPPSADVKHGNGEFKYEKGLEWWLTYHLDSNEECRKIFGVLGDIHMFANYVPISISGGNIDLVVYHRSNAVGTDMLYKISIVELKKSKAGFRALQEIQSYTRWFVQNITGSEGADIIQPIIIASGFSDDALKGCKYWHSLERKPRLFKYRADSKGNVSFEEVSYD